MARKDIFAGISDQPKRQGSRDYVAHGAAKAMIGSLEEFKARAQGSGVLELDPNIIDPSPFRDRLPDDDNLAFEEFKASMAKEGQKVPVQVRSHPVVPGRYQLVYGHRRVQAAKELGLQIKAIPIQISDTELVVAQGIENGARQDLSWIERALFAKTMESADVKPREIKAALSIEDAELTRMRGVYNSVPNDIIELIGRAPKVGRPRWMDLAKVLGHNHKAVDRLRKTLPAVKVLDSNQRFQAALDAVKERPAREARDHPVDGLGSFKFTASTARGQAFAKFIVAKLPALIEMFEKEEN